MPPKKGSAKAKSQDLVEMKKQSKDMPPVSVSPQPIKSKYLRIYNNYNVTTKGNPYYPSWVATKAKKTYLRKIGALQYHRMADFNFEAGGSVYHERWRQKDRVVLKRLKQIKRLQEITIKIQTTSSIQRIKILKKVTSHLPHWSSLKLHVTLPTLTATGFLKEKSEQGLIRLLPRELRCHSINSAGLKLQGDPYKVKTPKKRSGKGKPQAKDTEFKFLKHFMFNPLAKLQKLYLSFEEKKYFTAFRPLLEEKVFPELKSLSILASDGRFSIRHQTETIVDPAIDLIGLLLGKASKTKTMKNTKATSKPEITIRGYDSVIRDNAQALSALGTLNLVAVMISRTKEGEFAEMFSHLKDLRYLAFQYSPTADWQVREVCQGISNIHSLTVLELYFKNYTFSEGSVKQIYKSILKLSPTLKNLWLGFQDVENLNDTTSIMDLVLQIPNLTLLRLYLGCIDKKSLIPLRNIAQLKKLTHLEIGAYFRTQKPEEIILELIEICKNLQTLRHLHLKPVWGKEVNSHTIFYRDFKKTQEMLAKKLKTLYIDLNNHTWL